MGHTAVEKILADHQGTKINYANQISQYTTGVSVGYSSTDKIVIYGGIALLVINAVIFLMAFAPLKLKAQRGWDLLFLASLINIVYGVAQIFISGRGVGDFILSLIGTAIGLYLLFQVKDYYGKKGSASSAPVSK